MKNKYSQKRRPKEPKTSFTVDVVIELKNGVIEYIAAFQNNQEADVAFQKKLKQNKEAYCIFDVEVTRFEEKFTWRNNYFGRVLSENSDDNTYGFDPSRIIGSEAIEPLARPVVYKLNEMGIPTFYSCSGHMESGRNPQPYLRLKKDEQINKFLRKNDWSIKKYSVKKDGTTIYEASYKKIPETEKDLKNIWNAFHTFLIKEYQYINNKYIQ